MSKKKLAETAVAEVQTYNAEDYVENLGEAREEVLIEEALVDAGITSIHLSPKEIKDAVLFGLESKLDGITWSALTSLSKENTTLDTEEEAIRIASNAFRSEMAHSIETALEGLYTNVDEDADTFEIWRMIHVEDPQKFIESIQAGTADMCLGIFWSYLEHKAEAHNAGKGIPVLLYATAPASSVDWVGTYEAALENYEEFELTLKKSALVHLNNITVASDDAVEINKETCANMEKNEKKETEAGGPLSVSNMPSATQRPIVTNKELTAGVLKIANMIKQELSSPGFMRTANTTEVTDKGEGMNSKDRLGTKISSLAEASKKQAASSQQMGFSIEGDNEVLQEIVTSLRETYDGSGTDMPKRLNDAVFDLESQLGLIVNDAEPNTGTGLDPKEDRLASKKITAKVDTNTVYAKVKLTLVMDELVDLDDVMNEMDYDFTSNTSGADIDNMELIDYRTSNAEPNTGRGLDPKEDRLASKKNSNKHKKGNNMNTKDRLSTKISSLEVESDIIDAEEDAADLQVTPPAKGTPSDELPRMGQGGKKTAAGFSDPDLDAAYDMLTEYGIATEEEIGLVFNINGTNMRSIESILYARTGYRSVEQYEGEMNE